ncbi:SymE family type I addiction module toxin [Paraburkholderia sp. J10-1]|uniref:SymE family type I addiction module toxin n=1 Tax=Paraburkholderia sp. J10-1 TaxID=2805430 RepID=UPI0039EFA91E
MADANLKLRPPVTERFVTIQQSQRAQRNWRSRTEPPLYPWMKLAGRWIEQAGFAPGQRVRIAANQSNISRHRTRPCVSAIKLLDQCAVDSLGD